MSNSLFNIVQSTQMSGLGQIYQAMNSGNPMQVFSNLAMTNPQLQPIVSMLRSGNSPEQVFRSLAKQRGINPDEFIQNIQGSMR